MGHGSAGLEAAEAAPSREDDLRWGVWALRIGAVANVLFTLPAFIAYDWYECGKPLPHWANVAQECAISERGAIDLSEVTQ